MAPSRSRMAIARPENPHCGNRAVPFMKRTTSLLLTMSAMREAGSVTFGLQSGWHCGFELQCVKLTPHSAPERGIDRLMLADPAEAGEAAADHARRIMVAVAGKVADRDLGAGNGGLDQRFDLACGHRHSARP